MILTIIKKMIIISPSRARSKSSSGMYELSEHKHMYYTHHDSFTVLKMRNDSGLQV